MEHVEGFELGRIGPSLEFAQRARILIDICGALEHAHALGLQHRDLKPSNIMLDAQLAPRILDFGLSSGHPYRGHLKGTLHYVAPEQLDPSQPIDRRTDIYALGVVLYELLCGRPPYAASSDEGVVAAIRAGQPRLPVEIDPRVPEPLQAVALKAMERDPALRYQSALELGADLQRYLDGRPVHARPSVYASTLGMRVAPHVQQIGEWLRLKLIYPHEAERLHSAYRALDAREDDWIVESRALSYSQIALYLGAFLLVCGSLFYFAAHRWYDAVSGVAGPLLVLGLPFAGLNAAAHHLYRRDHKAVAVAFFLAAVGLLPLLLIILFHETGFLVVAAGDSGSALSRWIDLEPPAAGDVARRVRVVRRAGAPHAHRGAQHGVRDPGLLLWCLGALGPRPAVVARGRPLGSAGAQRAPAGRRLRRARSAGRAPAASVVRQARLCRRRGARSSSCWSCWRSTAGRFTTSASRCSPCSRRASAIPCSSTRWRR